ncbi:hypothetical protein CRG98_020236 [Punica granatum]|uniref:Uncharacterized protein n=1 Tax=Punica granatum TaxID=22663 RepID=A0A2I0JSU4_PUNGR|nr:hypothetical protein CRG98_020236 [Punica granatum]
MEACKNMFFTESIKQYRLHAVENVIPFLGIRGKSRRSVRESGDSVEYLEGCSVAKDARLTKMGTREDVRHAGLLARRGAAGGARGTRGCARQRVAMGALFTREHVLHPE